MQKSRRAFTLVELMVVVAIIGILIAITLPATNKALNRAKRLQCASNLKQLSAAVLLYCKDHKGEFPVQFSYNVPGQDDTQWAAEVIPYLGKKYAGWTPTSPAKDRPVFFCPNAMKHHPGTYEGEHGSYGMNSDLMIDEEPSGPPKRISSFSRTSATIMMADGHWGVADANWWAGMTFSRGEY
ncbi:MAG: type II secretion system protein, partial [Kiritimatiellae bacterium]|nr:type II secretion system protein [Kiritimatiellia bacterium]